MKKKRLWWIVILAGITAAVIYFIRSPATGKITYNTGKSPTPSPMEYIRYDASNFSFSYENKYQLQDNGSSWELVGNAEVPIQIVITAIKAKSADVEDISGVLMRRIKKTDYAESTINWGNTEGLFFNKADGTELTAFFLKDGWAVTVAMTANSNDNTGLHDEFQKLVDSMEIKNPTGTGD